MAVTTITTLTIFRCMKINFSFHILNYSLGVQVKLLFPPILFLVLFWWHVSNCFQTIVGHGIFASMGYLGCNKFFSVNTGTADELYQLHQWISYFFLWHNSCYITQYLRSYPTVSCPVKQSVIKNNISDIFYSVPFHFTMLTEIHQIHVHSEPQIEKQVA